MCIWLFNIYTSKIMEDKKIYYYSTSLLIFYKYTIVYLSRNLANNIITTILQNLYCSE